MLGRGIWTVRLGLTAALAAACISAKAEAAVHPKPFVSEARMEFILDHLETQVGALELPLCMGIGRHRGEKVIRFQRFICAAVVDPDAHIILRTSLTPRGRVVFG